MTYSAIIKRLCLTWIGILLLAACSVGHSDAHLYPEQISCVDHSTPEMMHKFEKAFGRLEGASVTVKPESNEEKHLFDELLQSSRELANSGNPYGMGFFADVQRDRLIIAYLDESHISDRKKATSVELPEGIREDMVNALSYIYIAVNVEGAHQERSREVIDHIENPESQDNTLLSNYVSIPSAWIAEANANAIEWKAHCSKK
jgi:hypothetical protein